MEVKLKKIFVIIILLFGIINSILFAQAKFTISPPYFELFLKPKEIKTIIITAENAGDSTIHIKIYPNDWDLDTDDSPLFVEANTFENSCSNWFYINPMEFNLEPHSDKDIRITLQVPENVFGEYKSIIFFETTPYKKNPNSMIQFNSRLGSAIYVSIIGTVSKNGDIIGIEYNEKDSYAIALFENTGNMHCRVTANLKIYDFKNKLIYEKDISSQLSLPGRTKKIKIPVDTYLNSGSYTFKIRIDYGGNELLEGEKTIIIK